MQRFLITILLMTLLLGAKDISFSKAKKLSAVGEKIVQMLCEKSKLPKATGTLDALSLKVQKSEACGTLNKEKSKAVAFYLLNGSLGADKGHIDVPKDAKCSVCGMFVHKYPKWTAVMVVAGKKYYFDGVKDMMKFYFFDQDFPYNRADIEQMKVSDFYTLEPLDATKAYYVIGSNIFGPMGNELIPFKSKKEAENFIQDHKGKKIVLLKDITAQMVMALDGVQQ